MKTIHLSLLAAGALAVASCGKDFLNVDPIGRELEINYYQNPGQAYEALVSVYDVLQWNDQNGFSIMYLLQTVASDDAHAGGSDASDQPSFVAYDNFSLTPNLGPQAGFWRKNYRGIYRANLFLEKIDGVPGTTNEFVQRTTAEAKFLRAFYYMDLLRLFGSVPLITKPLSPRRYSRSRWRHPRRFLPKLRPTCSPRSPIFLLRWVLLKRVVRPKAPQKRFWPADTST